MVCKLDAPINDFSNNMYSPQGENIVVDHVHPPDDCDKSVMHVTNLCLIIVCSYLSNNNVLCLDDEFGAHHSVST